MTSRRKAPCGSPKSKARRRRSWRRRASSPTPAPSRSRARARSMSKAERWSLPEVEGPVVGRPRETPPEPGSRAWKAEQSRGYEAGVAAARAEMQAQITELQERVRRLDGLLTLLAQPLADLDEQVQ